jgi:hypothetical protein
MDPSGVYPVLPTVPSPVDSGKLAPRGALLEDEVLASWLDILVADGLVPARAITVPPL